MTQFDVPRLATVDDDGWSLQNAEERFDRADGLYWLPDQWIREHLEDHVPDGGFAKLLFVIHDVDDPRAPAIERMWVTFSGRVGTFYHGHLANEPYTRGAAKEGMPSGSAPSTSSTTLDLIARIAQASKPARFNVLDTARVNYVMSVSISHLTANAAASTQATLTLCGPMPGAINATRCSSALARIGKPPSGNPRSTSCAEGVTIH
jgi:hypothetical protein